MPSSRTATRQLLDLMLDGQLDALVAEWRDEGLPWRLIAREIYERTGVDITAQAVRSWYIDDRAAS